jgi:hypothetical protein
MKIAQIFFVFFLFILVNGLENINDNYCCESETPLMGIGKKVGLKEI